MLTPSLPFPAHQGGAIRNFGILRGLHDAGHEVTLISFHENGFDPATSPLSEVCVRVEIVAPPARSQRQRVLDIALTGQPDLARRLDSEAFRAKLDAVLSETKFDLVQFEGLEMAIYLPFVLQRQPGTRLCYDAHNAEAALQWAIFNVERTLPGRWLPALYSWLQARRIARFEREVCHKADCVLAVSAEDAKTLRVQRPNRPVAVVPNGIFAEHYANIRQRIDLGQHVLVFTGKMDYRPNVDAMLWFTANVFPLVLQQVPDARLYIVGQKPHASLEALRDQPNIEITGFVAEIQPFLGAADVYIAPLRMGSGTRLKLLEAMAAGCAVVATPAAASGLGDEVQAAMLIAEDADAFASAVVALLNDPARCEMLGSQARLLVKQHYDWSKLMPCLFDAYREIGLG